MFSARAPAPFAPPSAAPARSWRPPDMDPSRSNRILRDWSAVANSARRPVVPPRGVVVRGGLPSFTFAGMAVAALAIVVAVAWLGTRGPTESLGSAPPASAPAASPVASPSTPTPGPTLAPCDPATLAARVKQWEGAAGSRIADVELRNAGATDCTLEAMDRPQLVDGSESILIDGKRPTSSPLVTLKPGDVVSTLVQASNYCGAEPQPPVTVSFVFDDGGRVVASPLSATDATPPCMGSGSPASIEMHPWSK